MKIQTTGKTLNELYEEYGQGANGFYSHWWAQEDFANDRPEAGEYEVLIEKKALEDLAFEEQKKKFKKGYEVPHPAILAEALLKYHKEMGKYLMKDWYSRTSLLFLGGHRVIVGYCDADGVVVSNRWVDLRFGDVGLAASWKFKKNFDPRSLEPFDSSGFNLRISELESFKEKVEKILKL